MVTNAQFPEQMETLTPVTQLYISRRRARRARAQGGRPPALLRLLGALPRVRRPAEEEEAAHRRVRMTLVNGWNTQQLSKYVELVRRGRPDFVEVKGVTYCGDSKASPLDDQATAPSTPRCAPTARRWPTSWGTSTSSRPSTRTRTSCSSRTSRSRSTAQWHTWIDYDKFAALATAGKPFGSMDYLAPTPEWAVYRRTRPTAASTRARSASCARAAAGR